MNFSKSIWSKYGDGFSLIEYAFWSISAFNSFNPFTMCFYRSAAISS